MTLSPSDLESLRQTLLNHEPVQDALLEVRHDTVAAMIAAAGTPKAATAYLRRHSLTLAKCTAVELLLFVQSEYEPHEDQIDEALERKDTFDDVLKALALAHVPWTHQSINIQYKTSKELLAATAMVNMLAKEGEKQINRTLNRNDDAIQLLHLLRAATLLDAPYEYDFDALYQHCVDEKALSLAGSLEALWAAYEPSSYARNLLAGDVEFSLTQFDQAVADVFHLAGSSSWLETLALLSITRQEEARQFATGLAVCAALTMLRFDENASQNQAPALRNLLEARGEGDDWISHALDLGLQLPVAAAEEDHAVLFVETCAHELLLQLDEASCGIGGLPLSSNVESEDALQAALALFKGLEEGADPAYITAVVRTLVDAKRWFDQYEVEGVATLWQENEELFDDLCQHDNAAVSLAANRLGLSLDPQGTLFLQVEDLQQAILVGVDHPDATPHFVTLALTSGTEALWAASQLATLATEDAVASLGGAWGEGHPLRGGYLRDLIWQVLEDGEFL